MRLVMLAVVLVACEAPAEDDVFVPLPDAYTSTCGIGAFEIAAPKPDLIYSPSLIVYVNESELWAELELTMVDDLGTSYQWTHDDSRAQESGPWWNLDRFWYELAPSRRYDLTVRHRGCAEHDQTVTFFTRAE